MQQQETEQQAIVMAERPADPDDAILVMRTTSLGRGFQGASK